MSDQPGGTSSSPIAVVGMSCLFPNAAGLHEYWRLIRWGEDAVREVPATHWPVDDYYSDDPAAADRVCCRRGAFLSAYDFDPTEFGIPPAILEAVDTSQLLGLVVAKGALEDAGYGESREFDRSRASVILGVTGTLELVIPLGARLGGPVWKRSLQDAGVDPQVAEDVVRRIGESYVGWQENSFPGLLGNVVAGRIANRFNLRGTNCVVDAACASSLSALHLATLELAAGKSDIVLTGGVDTFNDVFMFMCFSKTQAISHSGDAKPFSADADGTVLGEGVGMLVLKRLADAGRDGDRIYAVIRGIGSSSDGRSQSIYAPRSEGQAEALRNAYCQAGVEPATVELVEAHGTGTKVGDVVEFDALRSVFRESRAEGRWCSVGSVKSQIGHTKAAAGAASLIKTVLALHHRVIPPTIKISQPNARLELGTSPFHLSTQVRPWVPGGDHPRRAGVSSFGFGGSNFHVVLEEHRAAVAEPAWDGSVQVVALSAPSRQALADRLEECCQWASKNHAAGELAAWAAGTRASFSSGDAYRLVLVVERGADVAALLRQARERMNQQDDDHAWSLPNVYFGGPDSPGKLAFLFPGQASQYVAMGTDLVCLFPEALAAIEAANADSDNDARLADLIFPPPTFSPEEKEKQQQALTQTQVAQPAIGAVSVALLRVLQRFGVRPDVVAGHSFGELVALHAAGCIDDATVRHLARARGRLMAAGSGDRGTMAAVQAPLDDLEQLVAASGLPVVVANRNAPSQGVISGARAAVEQVAEQCRDRGWRVTPLAVSGAFHSELMKDAGEAFADTLAKVTWRRAELPVCANVTAQQYPDDVRQAKDLLASQLTRPVLFDRLVENMHEAGARTWVEVGPMSKLCGLVRAVLGERTGRVLAVDASAGRRSGVLDLARALAELAALGHGVNLSEWERPVPPARPRRMIVPIHGANYRPNGKAARPAIKPADANRASGRTEMKPGDNTNAPKSTDVARSQPAGQAGAVSADHLRGTLEVVQEGLRAMQALQQQTAAAHQRFLEGQELAHKTFQQVLETQQLMIARLGGLPAGALPVTPPTQVHRPVIVEPKVVEATAPSAPRETSGNGDWHAVEAALIKTVSDNTGYPYEMIHLDMDLEDDLGIDAVRRVEVVSRLAQRVPSLSPVSQDEARAFRTLREIVERAVHGGSNGKARAEAPATPVQPVAQEPAQAVGGAGHFEEGLLRIVSELTGYPVEMLELDMDMEADLGIDSIKRVEVLAAVQERFPNLKAVNSSYAGSLRTLRSIISYMSEGDGDEPGEADLKKNAAPKRERDEVAAGEAPVPLARSVLTAVELPAATPSGLHIATGREVWITDDDADLATALADRVRETGVPARVVAPSTAHRNPPKGQVGGLVMLSPPDPLTSACWSAESEVRLRNAFLLAKSVGTALRNAAEAGGALLASVSRLDGAFGLRGGAFNPLHGGLAGLVKTAAQEWPQVRCRALDLPVDWNDASAAAEAVFADLAADGPIEVGLDRGERWGLELGEQPAPIGDSVLSAGDVVLVTGGAKGVTAEAAVALAREVRPVLVLVGRSPAPADEPSWLAGLHDAAAIKKALLANEFSGKKPKPTQLETAFRRVMSAREISGTLSRVKAAGARVAYRCVDVTDAKAVRELVRETQASLGPIRGIIHGAGVIEDRLIDDKQVSQCDAVFNTKVAGLRNLLDAVDHDELICLALFSSVSGRFGRQGQVDYAMANEVLNKAAQRLAKEHPAWRVVSINWGPWDGGMVTPALKREFERIGVDVIPLDAGAQCLVNELRGAGGGAEVVIGASLPAAEVAAPKVSKLPAMLRADLDVACERSLDVESHAFLRSHVLAGKAVLPAAMMLEWLGHGAMHANPGLTLHGFEDFRVFKGVILAEAPYPIRVLVPPLTKRDGVYVLDAELRGGPSGSKETLHSGGRVLLAASMPAAPRWQASREIGTQPYPRDVAAAYRDVLFHGPHFHAIERIDGYSREGMTAMLRMAPPPAEWMQRPHRTSWLADPLIVDGALQLGWLWSAEQMDAPALPSFGRSYRQYGAFPPGGTSAVLQVRSAEPRKLIADVALLNDNGNLIAMLEGFEWTIDPSLRVAAGREVVAGAGR